MAPGHFPALAIREVKALSLRRARDVVWGNDDGRVAKGVQVLEGGAPDTRREHFDDRVRPVRNEIPDVRRQAMVDHV